MGRQICFFNTPEEYMELVKIVKTNGGILINYKNEEVEEKFNDWFLVKLKNSNLFYWDANKFLPFEDGQYIERSSSEIITLNWCSKVQYPNNDSNGYEHGRFWYETSFYNNDNKLEKKSEELDSLYKSLKRFITKNYILSKNKHWYIGPEAYNLYLQGLFIPYSGLTKIEF